MSDLKIEIPEGVTEVIVHGLPNGGKFAVSYTVSVTTFGPDAAKAKPAKKAAPAKTANSARSIAQRKRWAEQKRKQREADKAKAAKK